MTGGVTTIADRVVEKIAAQASTEVPAAGGAARRVLGVALGEDQQHDRPVVHATVDGSVVTVEVSCSVAYPEPVADVTDAVRRTISDRVTGLTGLTVAQVDITVISLLPAGGPSRRRVR